MAEYYISKYNFYIEEAKTCCYIYNAVSGSILKLSHRLYAYIKQQDEGSKNVDSELMSDVVTEVLKENKIIYLTRTEERSYLEYLYLRDTYDDSFLSLVLLPTLKCNLNCHYCYEKEKNTTMDNTAIEQLKVFFTKQAKLRRCITVRWSGGEMMTYWDEIKQLSKHIIKQCELNECSYVASAISNGSLLTENRLDEMLECGIRSLQITLDGDRNHHNEVRKYKNGAGTYDKILGNIEFASKKMKIIVRLNLDKNNYSSIENLFRDISSLDVNKSNIQIFCKPVVCTAVRTPINGMYTQNEFYDIELSLLKLSEIYNLPYSFHWGINGRNTRCAYSGIQGFYVTPNMRLYKCPVFLDQGKEKDNSIGYINSIGEMVFTNYTEFVKGISYSPFKIEECKYCKVLPICHGKCPVLWENSGRVKESGCISEKYSIEEKIKYAIRSKMQMNAYNKSGIV